MEESHSPLLDEYCQGSRRVSVFLTTVIPWHYSAITVIIVTGNTVINVCRWQRFWSTSHGQSRRLKQLKHCSMWVTDAWMCTYIYLLFEWQPHFVIGIFLSVTEASSLVCWLQKMVAIPTTKVANILNCFTFSKDRLIVLELIALWVHF